MFGRRQEQAVIQQRRGWPWAIGPCQWVYNLHVQYPGQVCSDRRKILAKKIEAGM